MTIDAAVIGAACTGMASIIASAAVLVKIVLTRPRIVVAENVLQRMKAVEDRLLLWAELWHDAQSEAALQGFHLPELPDALRAPIPHPPVPHTTQTTQTAEAKP